MADGAVPIGPTDGESTPCPTSVKEAASKDVVLTRWTVLVVLMIGAVLDLGDVVQLPTESLLELLLYVL